MKKAVTLALLGLVLCFATQVLTAHGPTRRVADDLVRGSLRTLPFPIDMASAVSAGVAGEALQLALSATACGVASGDLTPPPTLTVIDYSRPSTEPRLWVFDLRSGALKFKELVAHGKATGENMAKYFSDALESHQSSLGLFVARDTYVGSNGYSLRLDGLEPGFNGHARERAIVMHGAPYVSAEFARKQGRLGRSWGCPALGEAVARRVIDTVRDGGVIFSYYPDPGWLARSRFLNCAAAQPPATAAGSEASTPFFRAPASARSADRS